MNNTVLQDYTEHMTETHLGKTTHNFSEMMTFKLRSEGQTRHECVCQHWGQQEALKL